MHLTRAALDVWAASNPVQHSHAGGRTILVLVDGDSMDRAPGIYADKHITGPAVVELVVYRDGGWSAREMVTETPESIALAASLAQRTGLRSLPYNARPIIPRRDQI